MDTLILLRRYIHNNNVITSIKEKCNTMSLKHVNINKIKELVEATKQDLAAAKMTPSVHGEWIFETGQPQFRSEINVEGGQFTAEADMPSKLGGWGSRPGPLHWCYYGIASCYAFTFAAVAAMEGVTLTKLAIDVEGHVDFSKVFGVTDNPIVEGVRIQVLVTSSADAATLERIQTLAEDRCPALDCLTRAITVTTELV
jgi:uncharacterized OsmC-like protein